jgi:hypothetical protein
MTQKKYKKPRKNSEASDVFSHRSRLFGFGEETLLTPNDGSIVPLGSSTLRLHRQHGSIATIRLSPFVFLISKCLDGITRQKS